MGATVQLASTGLVVEPGRSVTTTVTVRNTGSVVDRFSFEALGPLAGWITFSPDHLSLFPEATGSVELTIAPPRVPTVAAGKAPFGVKVAAAEDPAGSAAEEGTVDVAAFSDVGMELLPRIVYGRRIGLARLAVDNRSNVPYDGSLSAADPASALQYAFRPPAVSVPPGAAEFVRVRLRPVKTFWRGPNQTRPFQIEIASDAPPHPARVSADGSMLQEALLPRWAMALIAALVALAVLAVVLWFTVLKPQIRSTAKNEVKTQLAAQGLSAGGGGGSPSGSPSGGSGSGAGSGSGGGSGSTTPTSVGTSTAAAGTGTSGGLTVNGSSVAPGNGNQIVYTVPAGRTLQVTDLLVQNAAGDSGTLTLFRNGEQLMQWSMADFRDLDYHWVSPTIFATGAKMTMSVSGCAGPCHPALYYAGNLVRSA